MPTSGCGVHELSEFVIEYANFSLFSEHFFTYPILSSFPSQSLAFANTHFIFVCGVALRSKQTNEVHMNRFAYPLPEAARIAGSYTRPRVSYRLLHTDKKEHVNER